MRHLLWLFPLVVVAPHVVRLPGSFQNTITAREFKDDGESLPTPEEFEQLARADPVAMMKMCLRRHNRQVEGYNLLFHKQERIGGRLQKKEIIDVHFREKPHSALLKWREGARKASRALYVEGENDGKILVKPAGLAAVAGVVRREVKGADAKASGRYTLDEFGLKKGLERALTAWENAKKDDALHVEYLGKNKVPALGGRPCFELKRSKFKAPESDGVSEHTLYVDAETWLLVGTVLKDKDGKLIAEYYFRDVVLNPKFEDGQFTEKALKD